MLFVRGVSESVAVSDSVEWSMKRGLIGIITQVRNAKKRRDYYTAVSLSCSYIQYWGKQLLGFRLNDRKDLGNIIKWLYEKEIVDQSTRDDMNKINVWSRIPYQHNGLAFEFSSKQLKEQTGLTVVALRCLEYLKRYRFMRIR